MTGSHEAAVPGPDAHEGACDAERARVGGDFRWYWVLAAGAAGAGGRLLLDLGWPAWLVYVVLAACPVFLYAVEFVRALRRRSLGDWAATVVVGAVLAAVVVGSALGWARLGAPGGIAGWVAVLWGLTAMVYAGSALRRRRAGVSG